MNHKTVTLLKSYARETGRKYEEVRQEWLRANWRERSRWRREMRKAVGEDETGSSEK
jgi:hypothetical protein